MVKSLVYTTTTTTACNGSNGGLTTTHSGGAEPVTSAWLVPYFQVVSATGLGPGTLPATSERCQRLRIHDQVEIPDHVVQVTIPQVQDSISCTTPFVTIQGLQVQPEQSVTYEWTATTASGTTPGYSTSGAPEVGQPGNYSVVVTDPVTGCTDEADVMILPTAVPTVDLSTLLLPNVVSRMPMARTILGYPYVVSDPDRDITALFDEYTLTTYNRWGQVMARPKAVASAFGMHAMQPMERTSTRWPIAQNAARSSIRSGPAPSLYCVDRNQVRISKQY